MTITQLNGAATPASPHQPKALPSDGTHLSPEIKFVPVHYMPRGDYEGRMKDPEVGSTFTCVFPSGVHVDVGQPEEMRYVTTFTVHSGALAKPLQIVLVQEYEQSGTDSGILNKVRVEGDLAIGPVKAGVKVVAQVAQDVFFSLDRSDSYSLYVGISCKEGTVEFWDRVGVPVRWRSIKHNSAYEEVTSALKGFWSKLPQIGEIGRLGPGWI